MSKIVRGAYIIPKALLSDGWIIQSEGGTGVLSKRSTSKQIEHTQYSIASNDGMKDDRGMRLSEKQNAFLCSYKIYPVQAS